MYYKNVDFKVNLKNFYFFIKKERKMTKKNIFQNQNGKMKKIWNYFNLYEKLWFLIFSLIAIGCSIILPEDSAGGIFGGVIDGTVITIFVVVSTIIGLFCELLSSKQSKWQAFIYIFVEFLEITRFLLVIAWTQMFVCLLFWLPMHIITFINWDKNKDKQNKEKTVVRSLKPNQVFFLIVGVFVWTAVFGYLFAYLTEGMNLFNTELSEAISPYLDACLAGLAIANGILLFFRYKENWIVWLIYSILSIPFYIINGWYVFIVLQLGYITNTIYGYLCWTKYIKSQQEENQNIESLKENLEESSVLENENTSENQTELNENKQTEENQTENIQIEENKKTETENDDDNKTN